MFQSRGRSPRFPAGRQKFVPRNHSRGSPSSRSITRECCIAAAKGVAGRVGGPRRFSSGGEGRRRAEGNEKERGRDDGPVSRQVASSHGAPIHHRGCIHTARMRISTDTRASRDENVDYAAFLLLSLSLFFIHRLLSFLLPFFRASLPSLALPSSIVGPRTSPPPLSLSLASVVISVRVSSRFTTVVDPGRGGLYLLRLALQIGRSKKISLKKCQYSYIYIYICVCLGYQRTPVIKSSGFSCFSESLYRTRFFLFLFSSLRSLFLARGLHLLVSFSLSLFFFPLDSRLNGSRSLALALTRSRVTRCFAVC